MRVAFRFLCADLPIEPGSQEAEITDGANIDQALAEFAKLKQMEDSLHTLRQSMFIIGKKPAQLDAVLHHDDELVVMRILHGG